MMTGTPAPSRVWEKSPVRSNAVGTGRAAVFRGLAIGGYLALVNGIHADAICELLIDSGIRYRLSVHREVVFIRSLAVEGRSARSGICGRPRYRLKKTRKIAAVEGDGDYLPARYDPR